LKFNRPFEKLRQRETGSMQSHAAVETRAALSSAALSSAALSSAALPKATPFLLRMMSKLVLEVLPASLASMIGAMLLAHYHFAQPALLGGGMAAAAPAPASPEMIRLVRDEHDLIRDFLVAQEAAQNSRHATADAQSAQAAADAKLAADASLAALAERRVATVAASNPPAARAKTIAVAAIAAAPPPAAASPGLPQASPAPLALAGLQDNAAPPAAPAHGALVATTLAMKDHVVSATLHAVMAIGGIPSWIGHRFDHDDIDGGERQLSAAS
jgi:hypothetical protein